MKTMKKGTDVIRVKEDNVNSYLKLDYVFCPKSEWKKDRKSEPSDKKEEKVKKTKKNNKKEENVG